MIIVIQINLLLKYSEKWSITYILIQWVSDYNMICRVSGCQSQLCSRCGPTSMTRNCFKLNRSIESAVKSIRSIDLWNSEYYFADVYF